MSDTTAEREAIVRIAKGLTEAQRTAILSAVDLMSNHGGYPFFRVRFTDHWTAPVAQFLTLTTDRLTPLGLAVRDYLKESTHE